MARNEHVTYADSDGRVHCVACDEVSPRLGSLTRQREWGVNHRRTPVNMALKETFDAIEKRGRGRPPIGRLRQIRVPDGRWAEIMAAAARKGIPVAEEARRRLARPAP